MHNGLLFNLSISASEFPILDTLSKKEFDSLMQTGFEQSKTGDEVDADEYFAAVRKNR